MSQRPGPLTVDEIRAQMRRRRADLDRLNVKRLSVFGSVAKGSARGESDLDVLVDFDGPADFDRFMDLKFLLEDLFGVRVDLVTRKALHERLRDAILDEAVHVA